MAESAAALVFAEPSGVIRIWNSAAESLFGHRAAEAIGQTLDLIVPPDYRGRHWEGYRAAMAAADGNIDHSSFDIPALRRDGTIIRVEVRLLVDQSLKFTVSTTSVSPSHRPTESPYHWRM